jgi:RNase P subunit RPR2
MKYAIWKRKKEDNKKIALERIDILETQIEKRKKEPELVRRYKTLITKISKKYRLQSE